MPDFTGHLIDNGRLQLLDSLGSGAYGKLQAVDTTTPKADRKYYAVKCLCTPKPGSRQDRIQKQEIAIQQLVHTHPNIVTLHKVICDGFFTYVVLDLCMGGDMFGAISESKIFYMNDLLIKHTFIQIIDAVHYCHQRGPSTETSNQRTFFFLKTSCTSPLQTLACPQQSLCAQILVVGACAI